MSKWKKWGKRLAKVAVFGHGYAFFLPAYYTSKNVDKKVYDYYTGHYQRQQERAEKNQQEVERMETEKLERQALQQRKEQINELRERIGAGGTRYRTDKQDRRVAKSIYSSGHNAETLG